MQEEAVWLRVYLLCLQTVFAVLLQAQVEQEACLTCLQVQVEDWMDEQVLLLCLLLYHRLFLHCQKKVALGEEAVAWVGVDHPPGLKSPLACFLSLIFSEVLLACS